MCSCRHCPRRDRPPRRKGGVAARWHTDAMPKPSRAFDVPVPDEGPSAAEAASQARALREAARLAADATTGLTALVEALHARRADARTQPPTGLVYRTVRGIARPVGGSVETLLALLAPALSPDVAGSGLDTPEREAVLAA